MSANPKTQTQKCIILPNVLYAKIERILAEMGENKMKNSFNFIVNDILQEWIKNQETNQK